MEPEVLVAQYEDIASQLALGPDEAIAKEMCDFTPDPDFKAELIYKLNDWVDQATSPEAKLMLMLFRNDVKG